MKLQTKKVDLQKIKYLRKQAKLSLEEMAKLLGYESANGYYYLEIGRGKFSAETLALVAEIFDIPINDLFFEDKIAEMATN
ncbi:helix-turn-helix domain-containing protein [Heyndrickxia oleronia]|uniref:helix-turn-helix domain-containing protein n=1 Tax=Heyndrickxia oleronia TaxID=38875 RepID=UPI001C0EDA67|nr:helix-turn-helix transcriptional regulator [Heyndrickxia oleronia]MBU5213256.1 helix-turn-helix domain-containing protein [Heyndrickxia oleronia]